MSVAQGLAHERAPVLPPVHHYLPANKPLLKVDPRGLEPLTSAMRGRSEGFAAVHYRSKNRLNKSNPRIVPPRMFAIVRAGCRQIVVSCIGKYWASKETLFKDRQVYSTPVHVVLEGSVQEARERMSGRQQTGSMQDPASELLRIPLPETVRKDDMKRPRERLDEARLPQLRCGNGEIIPVSLSIDGA